MQPLRRCFTTAGAGEGMRGWERDLRGRGRGEMEADRVRLDMGVGSGQSDRQRPGMESRPCLTASPH